MRFAAQVKPGGGLRTKAAASAFGYPSSPNARPYKDDWDIDRADRQALRKVVWVFRAQHVIADAQARLPFEVRSGAEDGESIDDHDLVPLLNQEPNADDSAYSFRYRLSHQVLLSRKGAFVEMVTDRIGRIRELRLLDPRKTHPVPKGSITPDGRSRIISKYVVELGGGQTEEKAPDKVLRFFLPHPLNPLMGMTPLEAAGISVDIDVMARLYNRKFLQNDGRGGGILGIHGDLDDDTADFLEDRFDGPDNAGRVTVLEAEGLDWVDMAVNPRDAQYVESRKVTKEDILGAYGTPESVAAGNASGRTFENVDAERYIFWDPTMLGHLALLGDGWNKADGDPETFASHDISGVDVLQRAKMEREKGMRDEVKEGVRTLDSYLEETGRTPTGTPEGRAYYQQMGLVAYASEDGELPAQPTATGA